jgi:hypothetical protein
MPRIQNISIGKMPPLGPRMRGIVGFFQALGRHVRVNLGRDEMRVAEQFLHASQIRAGVQQVRGVTVPQFVRRQGRVQAGNDQVLFQAARELQRIEQRGFFGLGKKTGNGPAGGCFSKRPNNFESPSRPVRQWARAVPFCPCRARERAARSSQCPPPAGRTVR